MSRNGDAKHPVLFLFILLGIGSLISGIPLLTEEIVDPEGPGRKFIALALLVQTVFGPRAGAIFHGSLHIIAGIFLIVLGFFIAWKSNRYEKFLCTNCGAVYRNRCSSCLACGSLIIDNNLVEDTTEWMHQKSTKELRKIAGQEANSTHDSYAPELVVAARRLLDERNKRDVSSLTLVS